MKSQISSTKPGPRPQGGDSEGETGNPPARWESEGQISGFLVSGVSVSRCRFASNGISASLQQVSAIRFLFPDT
jgi:hypothetical protein